MNTTPKPRKNVAAILAVVFGPLLSVLFVMPVANAAIVAGFIGEYQGRKNGLKLGRLAILGLLLRVFGV